MAKNNAKIFNIEPFIAAGMNPKTGLPYKLEQGFKSGKALLDSITKMVRIIDEQDAVNRYTWYNLPCDLTSQELERMLYFRGQLAFFYLKDTGKFYFMPYALDGGIDFYGRMNRIHPIPYSGGVEGSEEKNSKSLTVLRNYLSQIKLTPRYGMVIDELEESNIEELLTKSAVLLHDYTRQISNQNIIPRSIVNDGIIKAIAECVPFARTSLINGSGIMGVRVNDGDQAESVLEGAKSTYNAAIEGEPYVPILGSLEFQELASSGAARAQDMLMVMQSLDNVRLGSYGIENGGIFEKKAHVLETEAIMGSSSTSLVYEDGLRIRQNFANIVNSIWNLGIWCDVSESVMGMDTNGDGAAYNTDPLGQQGGIDNVDSDSETNV